MLERMGWFIPDMPQLPERPDVLQITIIINKTLYSELWLLTFINLYYCHPSILGILLLLSLPLYCVLIGINEIDSIALSNRTLLLLLLSEQED